MSDGDGSSGPPVEPGDSAEPAARGRWKLVVGAVGLVLTVLVVAGAVAFVRGSGEPSLPDWAVPVELPEVIEPPEDAEPLAEATAVGAGALLYNPCLGCGNLLVLTDGSQLQVSQVAADAVISQSLSPDGRWLASPVPGGVTMRDLAGTETRLVEADTAPAAKLVTLRPWVWSPDSRWALFGEMRVDDEHGLLLDEFVLLDLDEWVPTRVTATERPVVGLLPGGELLVARPLEQGSDGSYTSFELETFDPFESEATTSVLVEAGDWLESGESLALGLAGTPHLVVAPDAERLFVTVNGEYALLEVDLAGQVRRRIPLASDREGVWYLAGQLGGEVVVSQGGVVSETREFTRTLYAVEDDGLREITKLMPARGVRLPGTAAVVGVS